MSKVHLDSTTCEFMCPGCGQWHVLPIAPTPGHVHAVWAFSGDSDHPTLSPSILACGNLGIYDDTGEWTGEWQLDSVGQPIPYVCHSFLRNGRVEFLGDCTHPLAGQTADLPLINRFN